MAERETLRGWTRASGTSQGLAQRALIVLACSDGQANASVAVALGVTPQTVGKWRARFVQERLAGLADAPRPGTPRRICAGDLAWVLALTLLAGPRSSPRWSARSLGEECAMSPSSISRIWQGFGLRPGSIRPARLRSDAAIGARFGGLLGLYLDPKRRVRVRVHRVKSLHALRDWLAECDADGGEPRSDLILCECGSAAEAWARDWQATRRGFGLHVAPRGTLWPGTIEGWFAPEAGAKAPAGMARVRELVRGAMASGDGFEGGGGSYVWSAAGERVIRDAARIL